MHRVLRALLRERWTKLTDGELERVDGQVGRLTLLLAEKYGYPRRRAERELLELLDESMRRIDRDAQLVRSLGVPARSGGAQVAGVGVARDQRREAAGERGERDERGRRALVGAAELR